MNTPRFHPSGLLQRAHGADAFWAAARRWFLHADSRRLGEG